MTSPSRPGGFEGDLEALSVVEIAQTLSLGGKTARVFVRSSSGAGTMWFRDGVMTHATAGTLLGELAIYEMIEWNAGRFQVAYGLTSENRSIAGDTTHLLLEALRRVDERSSSVSADAVEAEVPPVLEADVRRERSRRLVFGATAIVLLAAAIAATLMRDGPAPVTQAAAAAVVVAPEPRVPIPPPRPAQPTSRPAAIRLHPKEKKVVMRQEPATAPASPLAEEPLPDVLCVEPDAAPSPTGHAPATAAPVAASRVRISGKSGAGGGTLQVLVDGSPVFTHERLDSDAPFEAEIAVTPGEHLIVARLEGGATAGVHEDSARGTFAGGETRLLRVTANRMFGSPVKVKLGRPVS